MFRFPCKPLAKAQKASFQRSETKYSQMPTDRQILGRSDSNQEDDLLCVNDICIVAKICIGYRTNPGKEWLCLLYTIITLGLIRLVWFWKPEWKLRARASSCCLSDATYVLLKDEYEQNFVRKVQTLRLGSKIERNLETNIYLEDISYKVKFIGDADDEMNRNNTGLVIKPCDVDNIEQSSVRFFEHRFYKYVWLEGAFRKLIGEECDPNIYKSDSLHNQLTNIQRFKRTKLFGKNSVEIQVSGYFALLFREVLNPFYVFQVFSITVWASQGYIIVGAAVAVLSVISISLSLYSTRKQSEVISNMSKGHGEVNLIKDNCSIKCDTRDLIPGDVIELPLDGGMIWCDCILLSGSCVANESSLTGESVPVFKSAVTLDHITNGGNEHSYSRQHELFFGTNVMMGQSSCDADDKIVGPRAKVIKTGFLTKKGKMIESIVSPKTVDFSLYRDSLCFIKIMAIIGVIGAIATIIILSSHKIPAGTIVLKILDLITMIVPPALPASLTVGTIIAQYRLKRAKIYCISPPRINISGKINCMCFDKTGTITEDKLALSSIIVKSQEKSTINGARDSCDYQDFYLPVADLDQIQCMGEMGQECIYAMASCHSLVNINSEVVGDPLDLLLFNFTNWVMTSSDLKNISCNLSPPTNQDKMSLLTMVKRFPFSSAFQRMTVVVKRSNKTYVYCKGAPAAIISLCKTSTVPTSFQRTLDNHTKAGCRVLALAYREVGEWNKREDLEKQLNFAGFVALENPLRPLAQTTVCRLNRAHIKTVMITGDNLHTAIAVAKKCRMVYPSDDVISVTTKEMHSNGFKVKFDVENMEQEKDTNSGNISVDMDNNKRNCFHFALSGADFDLLRGGDKALYRRILINATVFARMKPDQKMTLVKDLQELGYIVGMCGDGANDCGALKQAHVGVSLALVEASIAAPFTSKQGEKEEWLYQPLSVTSYFNDGQFLFGDIGVTGAVTLFFSLGGAATVISRRSPHSSLVSPIMLVTLILHIVIILLTQVATFETLKSRTWYNGSSGNTSYLSGKVKTEEGSVLFYVCSLQYIVLAIVLYKGRTQRAPLYKNYIYMGLILIFLLFIIILMFCPYPPLDGWFNLLPLHHDTGFKFILLAIISADFICAYINEHILLDSHRFKELVENFFFSFGACTVLSCCKKSAHNDLLNDVNQSAMHIKILKQNLSNQQRWPPYNEEIDFLIN